MKVFVAGATGVLGRRIVRQLVARRHSVVGLVRSREGERMISELGGQPRYADLFDPANLVHAALGCEAIIHAATSIPAMERATPADWQLNDRIRREGTEALARCAGQVGAKTFVFQSDIWVASKNNGSFDETTPPHASGALRSALDGEGISQEMGRFEGFAPAVLRCGWFYSADSAHTRTMAQALKARKLPIVGRGQNYWSLVHVDDAATAFVLATEAGRGGLWHVMDNEPVPMRDFLDTFAQLLHAPQPRRVPAWLARWFAGRAAVDFFTQDTRTSNDRFRNDFNWQPRYPSFREGLVETVAQLNGAG